MEDRSEEMSGVNDGGYDVYERVCVERRLLS